MLTLPPFQYHAPRSLDEAVGLLAAHKGDVKIIAGGTDLVPNMKHRLFTPGHVVGLKAIAALSEIREEAGVLRLGAMVSIAQLAKHERVNALFPALARAAEGIAGPQLREMGTLGGNICLDTRCVYYNQTYFWRQALGFCLKKDGTVCHVVKGGQKCVAAASNDTAPVLLTLGASVHILGPNGPREVPLDGFYVADGITNTVLAPDELVTHVTVPVPKERLLTGYEKLRIRAAIDYPALTVAVAVQLSPDKKVGSLRMAVSALGARPHAIRKLDAYLGRTLDDATIAELGQVAHKQCHPLTNINVDPAWRREMLPVFVRRAFAQALGARQ